MNNKEKNEALKKLYTEKTADFLAEYERTFEQPPPSRINEFGIIDEENYDDILVILRETRGWSDTDFENNYTFLQFVFDIKTFGKKMNKGRIGNEKIKFNMWYNLARWILAVENPSIPTEEISAMIGDETLKPLAKAAFTNINKVRGDSHAGKKYWKMANSEVAIQTIKKEIEILSPKIILCGGTARSLGDEFISELKKKHCKVINMWHPAAIKSKSEMIDEVKRQMTDRSISAQ